MWSPFTLEDLREAIDASEAIMEPSERRLWELVRVPFVKWRQEPWGNEGGGFWVVGILGQTVIWYNDIEEGFNTSRYVTFGVIADYWCNQDEVHHVMVSLRQQIESGTKHQKLGPPQPIDDDPNHA